MGMRVCLVVGTAQVEVDRLADEAARMRQRQRFEEARELYEQALDTAPNHARVHYELGGMLMQMGLHDEAVLALSDAVAEQPHIAEPRVSLGIALMQVRHTRVFECRRWW